MPTYSTASFIESGTNSSTSSGYIVINDLVSSSLAQAVIKKEKNGISPQLYFKFIKKNFKTLERFKFEARIKKLEKSFTVAAKNGQIELSEKILTMCVREAKESAMYAKGFKMFIEKDILDKHKRNIKNGHISDTIFSKYTRVIPKDVLEKKKKSEGLFDGYVIYHYWNEEAQKDTKSMSQEEKFAMRDPVLFGVIKESNRLYFIADWEDEYCTLTFDEMIDAVGDENIGELDNRPNLEF